MADWPAYPPDAAICRLLTGGPLPTTAVAERLAMPIRTTRHRLRQLRASRLVDTDADGLHRLAATALADLAASARVGHRPAGGGRPGPDGGPWTAVAALAAAVIGLTTVVVIGRLTGVTPAPPSGFEGPDDPWRSGPW